MTHPIFAVVGRVNEGKSSIVAALTENDEIAIGPEPGTTTHASPFQISAFGETLVTIVDTPGFQEPESAFAWLQKRATNAAEHADAISAFLKEFSGGSRFVDECRLLTPIVEGASVLYVVDASHPFRAGYEYEMKILRWTGQPCFAMINRTGSADYTSEWSAALKQYFNAVRPFNAHKSKFEDRINVLSMLAELDDRAGAALKRTVQRLREQNEHRVNESASVIGELLSELIGLTTNEPCCGREVSDADKQRLADSYRRSLERTEGDARARVEAIYQHRHLEHDQPRESRPIFAEELFSTTTWRLLGQTRARLIGASAIGGALVGGVIDAATLGHSFLAGSIIGGTLGAAAGTYAVWSTPETAVFGVKISGHEVIVGPLKDPNFAWILLDRALLHFQSIATRSHARRDRLAIEPTEAKQGLVQKLSKLASGRLEGHFQRLRRGKHGDADLIALKALLREHLGRLASGEDLG